MLSGARLIRFHHNDYDHLEGLLQKQKEKDAHVIIVSESVFGMDGDCADIPALAALARQYGAMLYIDEAHATGLFGPGGFGFAAEHKGTVDIAMGTFGKALGSFGAYIACSRVVRDYLVQRCGGLIYSTALPPPVLGAIDAALELLPQLQTERAHLKNQAARLRQALQQQGWNCGASTTQIIPVILGNEEAATSLAAILYENGILAPAIRPPTIPRGTSRLRFSLSAAHKAEDIDRLISIMAAEAVSLAAGLWLRNLGFMPDAKSSREKRFLKVLTVLRAITTAPRRCRRKSQNIWCRKRFAACRRRRAAILDIGCGTGFVAEAAARHWPLAHISAIDAAPAMLDEARRKLPHLANHRRRYCNASGLNPPIDLILSSMALHWMTQCSDCTGALAERA